MGERNSLHASTSGILLDLSDEQKITFSEALISGAEYDDTFGLYKNAHIRSHAPLVLSGGGDRDNGGDDQQDVNGNPINASLDMEIFVLETVSQFPSYDQIEFEDEVFTELKLVHKDKIRALRHLAWEAEQEMPNPVPMTGWATEAGRERTRVLLEGAAEVMEVYNKIKAEKHIWDDPAYEIPLLNWTPDDIRNMVNGRSRATQLVTEIHEMLDNYIPPVMFHPEVPVPVRLQNGGTDLPEQVFGRELPRVDPRSDIASPVRPSEPVLLCKDTSLSLRSLESESTKASASPSLRRSQSCAGTSRQFIPPIAASSPRPMRGDLNQSTSTQSAQFLQRQNSFKKTIATVKSSGYGKPSSSKVAPPSPGPRSMPSPIRASAAGIRSRSSLSLMGSPQRDITAIPSRQYTRGSPARSAPRTSVTTTTAAATKPDLDSTFIKGSAVAGMTQLRMLRPPSSTVTSLVPPADRLRNGTLENKPTGIPVSRLPAPAPPTTKKDDVEKMLNKFGFRK